VNFITITTAKVTNNNGGNMGNMTSGTRFTCSGWVKDGRLSIADNRWIPVGTYRVVETPPEPEPVVVDVPDEIMCRWAVGIAADGQTIYSEYVTYRK